MEFRDNPHHYVDYITIIGRRMVKIKYPRNLKERSYLWSLFRDLNIPIKKDNFKDLIGKDVLIKPVREPLNDTIAVYVIQGDDLLFNIKPVGIYFMKKEDQYANKL